MLNLLKFRQFGEISPLFYALSGALALSQQITREGDILKRAGLAQGGSWHCGVTTRVLVTVSKDGKSCAIGVLTDNESRPAIPHGHKTASSPGTGMPGFLP
jgi:hypothetical protein